MQMEMAPLLPERKKVTIEAVVLASIGWPIASENDQKQNDDAAVSNDKHIVGQTNYTSLCIHY
ncbi:unnamed protein product [Callosobruchus maculatus]|uniref:Uncharacterized protein n=1 Tax=Callosobruchus maculatus TaxID=64391 RepID=A0A653DFZ1_CALMS|nr:unnamed protein product [Callosobruchus maculatus]